MRGKILLDAMQVINRDRQDAYGEPEDSFQLIASYWNVYLDTDQITPRDVGMMMALLKIAREKNQRNRDNGIDAVGYIGLAFDMED